MAFATGSLGVIEDFFGEQVSARTADDLLALPGDQADELLDRLKQLEAPLAWIRTDALSAGTVSPLVSTGFPNQLSALFAIYFPTVAVPDPGLLHHLREPSESARHALARCMPEVVRFRPLIASGALLLYPPTLLTLAWSGKAAAPTIGDEVGQRLALSQEDNDVALAVAERMLNWARANLDEASVWQSILTTAQAVAGMRLNADLVAFSAAPRLLDVVTPQTPAALRISALQPVIVPGFGNVSPALAAQVREDSEAAAAVREALTSALIAVPNAATGPARQAAVEAFAENVREAAERFSKDVPRRPSLEAQIGSALSIGGAVVQSAAAGTLTAGAGYAAAAAPIPLIVSWLRARRTSATAKTASRLLLELIPERRA